MMEFILLLIIAGIAGSIAKTLVGFKRGGCVISIIVGFIGAYIGTILARELNFPDLFSINIGDVTFPVIWSIVGAALFVAVLSLFAPKNK
ncbi:MAG: GlsB/YeaQ/YmgE family stress response membrane protein [Ignavibacterium sp.]|nr:GlsB/YeaQ/YmgE family stress response membrane protein [Ignavibacterium sp.]